jgi:putative ABC transport system permease protein
MATGTFQFKVIGQCKSQMGNGMSSYMPINTIQDKMKMGDKINGFVIKTDSQDHDEIDRVSTTIEDEMIARGYVTENMIKYVAMEQNKQGNQQLINLMIMVGALIILITMVGLMSTLTMNVIERTKEIGMMRCLGSSSSNVRSMFATEGLMLSFIGWGIGIPVGYGVARLLNYMVEDLMHVEITFLFQIQFVLAALLITLIITAIIIQPPLWRATHFKPGDALRYE